MKKLFIILTFIFSNTLLAMDSDSKVILNSLDAKLSNFQKSQLDVDRALRASVKHYMKSRDQDFLLEVLKRYESLLVKNNSHYIVEMFYPLYKKNKVKFEQNLDKALSQKSKVTFLKRIKMVAREEEGGNG